MTKEYIILFDFNLNIINALPYSYLIGKLLKTRNVSIFIMLIKTIIKYSRGDKQLIMASIAKLIHNYMITTSPQKALAKKQIINSSITTHEKILVF